MPALPGYASGSTISSLKEWGSRISLIALQYSYKSNILVKRVEIENSSSNPGLQEALTRDPWKDSGKYALGWVYFSIILLLFTSLVRWFHFWTDRIRISTHEAELAASVPTESPDTDYELSVLDTDKSTAKFFPRAVTGHRYAEPQPVGQSSVSSISWVNNTFALLRFLLYRPVPVIKLAKKWRPIIFPSLGVICIVLTATTFVLLYIFIPQPLYWRSIRFGAPPITVRSGMLAISMFPWIIALSMKANFISLITGIGHERLNVLHRWGAYIFLLLSLIHTIPFYINSGDEAGMKIYKSYFNDTGTYVFGSGMLNSPFMTSSANF